MSTDVIRQFSLSMKKAKRKTLPRQDKEWRRLRLLARRVKEEGPSVLGKDVLSFERARIVGWSWSEIKRTIELREGLFSNPYLSRLSI